MEITVNHIATEVKEWCKTDSQSFMSYWEKDGLLKLKATKDLSNLFNSNYNKRVIENQQVFESSENIDLIFNPNSKQPANKILAEFTCESVQNTEFYEEYINKQIEKLTNTNIKEEYKGATKCIISLYFDLSTRNFLHENNFIEIFNNLEIGCAMKRLK